MTDILRQSLAALALLLPFALAQNPASGQAPCDCPPAKVETAPCDCPPAKEQKSEKKDKDDCKCKEEPSLWSKVPALEPFPRPGYPILFPAGKGYFSLLDFIQGNYREKPPQYAYPRFGLMQPSFFNANWRYLDKEDNKDHDFFDCLKRQHIGDNWLFTTGGDFRVRYNSETNSRGTGRTNTYTLVRTRAYVDVSYKDQFRVYGEFLDAHSFGQELAPLPIDVDRSDILNLFADVKLWEEGDATTWMRVGRQELLYGSQRLLSPLEWANTRRTFQGLKFFRQGKKLNVDMFIVQPVVPDPSNLDSVDNDVVFSGLWARWKEKTTQSIDFYVLNLDQTRNAPIRQGIPFGPFNITTIGGRFEGNRDNLLWDFEGSIQVGTKGSQDVFANTFTTAVGYQLADNCMKPQVWVGFDHASGDGNPGTGSTTRTYNQLFPFGHYYFGFADFVGRQNINDINGQFLIFPTKWITALVQFHVFRLDQASDALYNTAGIPIRRSANGAAGTDVGQEIDILFNFHLTKHQDILFSYSHLFAGDFLKRTGSGISPDYFYLQYVYRW